MLRRYFIALSSTTFAGALLPSLANATQPVSVGRGSTGARQRQTMVQMFRTDQRDTLYAQVITPNGYFLQRVQVSGDAVGTFGAMSQTTPGQIGLGNIRDANIWPYDNNPSAFFVDNLQGMTIAAYPEGAEDPSVGAVSVALLATIYGWIFPFGRYDWAISFWSEGGHMATVVADPAVDAPSDGSVVIPG